MFPQSKGDGAERKEIVNKIYDTYGLSFEIYPRAASSTVHVVYHQGGIEADADGKCCILNKHLFLFSLVIISHFSLLSYCQRFLKLLPCLWLWYLGHYGE